nr:MAG TPA: Arv1-like family protein [Bacteriophage sp.]
MQNIIKNKDKTIYLSKCRAYIHLLFNVAPVD